MSTIDIVNLVENNPITRLTNTYNNKLLTKIKDTFTDAQQQLFVSSFYCYLNYHPTNDFVIDLDNVWGWLGFNQKYAAKRLLERYFEMDKDYKVLLTPTGEQTNDGRGGHNKQTILLNIKTFKLFCIKAGTKKANEIHEYFVKLEEILQETVQEECEELKHQLETQTRMVETQKLEQEEMKEELDTMRMTRGRVPTVYIYDIDTRMKPSQLKIGMTHTINERIKPYRTTHPHGKLLYYREIPEQNLRSFENNVHMKLSEFRVQGEVFRIDADEAICAIQYEIDGWSAFRIADPQERRGKIMKIQDAINNIMHNHDVKTATCDASTQTDFDDATTHHVVINTPFADTFRQFIETQCIVRSDVECSAKDIVGWFRIHIKEAKREKTQAFTDYLQTRFKYQRLRHQDSTKGVMGYVGVKVDDRVCTYQKKSPPIEEEMFLFQQCTFTPSGTILYKTIIEDYRKWKINVGRPVEPEDELRMKTYLKSHSHVLFDTVWAPEGNGQGFYGLQSKHLDGCVRTSSTACKVEKRDAQELVLSKYETIAKAAASEGICSAKMSRCIKHSTVFTNSTTQETYSYHKVP